MARSISLTEQAAIDEAADIFNADVAREGRRYERGNQWYFRINGNVYGLPKELTRQQARALRTLDDTDIDGLLETLLGDQWPKFEKEFVTLPDIATILEAYGQGTGLFWPDTVESRHDW